MTNLRSDLPALLRAAGLEVIEVGDWRGRGRPSGGFAPAGSLNHHTGASAKTWTRAKRIAYAQWMFATGRSDLPAPLCQGAIGPDGEVYIGAAGRANHAGTARASGSVGAGDGNYLYVGWEWMLSGTESINAAQMQAGIVVNAVICKHVTGNSANTVSCHYSTSETGKWDIGDPNGVNYNGARVLDLNKFRTAVASMIVRLGKPPEPVRGLDFIEARAAHVVLDGTNVSQFIHDAEVIFAREYAWITGTGLPSLMWSSLRRVARAHGYRIGRYGGSWVAVRGRIIKRGTFKVVAPEKYASFATASFTHTKAGKITIVCDEAKTGSAKTAKAIRAAGQGSALAFYGGAGGADTPSSVKMDIQRGADRQGIGRFQLDHRTTLLSTRAYSDAELFLYADRALAQARYRLNLKK